VYVANVLMYVILKSKNMDTKIYPFPIVGVEDYKVQMQLTTDAYDAIVAVIGPDAPFKQHKGGAISVSSDIEGST